MDAFPSQKSQAFLQLKLPGKRKIPSFTPFRGHQWPPACCPVGVQLALKQLNLEPGEEQSGIKGKKPQVFSPHNNSDFMPTLSVMGFLPSARRRGSQNGFWVLGFASSLGPDGSRLALAVAPALPRSTIWTADKNKPIDAWPSRKSGLGDDPILKRQNPAIRFPVVKGLF